MRIQRVLSFALAFCLLVSAGVASERPAETFLLVFVEGRPNFAEAPNGDKVAVTGQGVFSLHPKSVTASGTFEHTDFAGNVLGGGTWTATQLLSYQSYGCGVFAGVDPPFLLPSNFCGGKLKLRVVLTAAGTQFDGILTVFCAAGPNPPNSHDEVDGVTLDIIGVINFNHVVPGGLNVYIRTSP